jgi:nucleotide-binding universal stress UspA family protein
MKTVMLATDGSPTAEKATATAIDLALELNTDLVIVSVWDIPYAPYSAMGFAPVSMNAEFAKLEEKEAAKAAAEAAARAEEAGVETRISVVRGFPVDAICEAADRFAPLFLVIGSHGWGVVKRALFGSVSTGVLHHAPCPVLVVRSEAVRARIAQNGSRKSVSHLNRV